MKRNASIDCSVHAKVAKIEDDIQELRHEAQYQPVAENVQFKLYCECAVPCDTLIVCVIKESPWNISMRLQDSHNFVKYQSVFRRHYAQLIRLVLKLNMPIGENAVIVYVNMC